MEISFPETLVNSYQTSWNKNSKLWNLNINAAVESNPTIIRVTENSHEGHAICGPYLNLEFPECKMCRNRYSEALVMQREIREWTN
jgi:hypothetical protein